MASFFSSSCYLGNVCKELQFDSLELIQSEEKFCFNYFVCVLFFFFLGLLLEIHLELMGVRLDRHVDKCINKVSGI